MNILNIHVRIRQYTKSIHQMIRLNFMRKSWLVNGWSLLL